MIVGGRRPEESGAGAGNAGSDARFWSGGCGKMEQLGSLGRLEAEGCRGRVQKQPAAPRAVPVEVVTAVKKKVPVRVDLLGTVTPIASVAVKTRVGHRGQGRAGYGLAIHS